MSQTVFYMTPFCPGPYMILWTMSQTILEMCCECPGQVLPWYNLCLGYLGILTIISQTILSIILDCFSYDTILFWTIYDPVNNVLDHSWNVLWMSRVGYTMMWSWSRVFINSHNHFPDHPAMSWTVFHMNLFVLDHIWPCEQCPGQVLPWYDLGPGYLWIPIIISQTIWSMSWTVFHMTLFCPGPFLKCAMNILDCFIPSCDSSPDQPMCVFGLLLIWYNLDPDYSCMIACIWNYYHW